MNFCRHCMNCYCCSYWACCNTQFINCWQAVESCGFSYLFCSACCWTLCAPICINCQIGSGHNAKQHLITASKFCCVAWGLCCISPIDAIDTCFKTCAKICGEDKLVRRHNELIEHSQTYGKSIIQFFGVELQDQPMTLMRITFKP